MRHFLLLLLCFSIQSVVYAQSELDIEKLLEANGMESTEDSYEEIVHTLSALYASPLNLNTADFDSLKMLYFLSDSQIDGILRFRSTQGAFKDVHELLFVPGIGDRDLRNIQPFIRVAGDYPPQSSIPRFRQEVIARLRMNLPRSEGYRSYSPHEFDREQDYLVKSRNRFQGIPMGSLIKYKCGQEERFKAGLTLENDPGEGYFTEHQPLGFDFVSAYIAVGQLKALRTLLAGDYRIQWGQGLTAWSGFSAGKSDQAVGNEKAARGILPNTSTDENRYFRGVALSLDCGRSVTLDAFASCKKTDATLVARDTSDTEDWERISLYESGYHRNDNECDKKHRLRELSAGLSCRWNREGYRLGVQAMYYDFHPGLRPGDRPYERYGNDGRHRWCVSVDYKTAWRSCYLFGETALCPHGAVATLNGVRMSGSVVAATLLYRRYDRRYDSYYASGFGEYGSTSNEEGLYCGLQFSLSSHWQMNVYGDWYHFFAPRYRASRPAHGGELMTALSYAGNRHTHALRYKLEQKAEDLPGGVPAAKMRQDVRYQWQWNIGSCIQLRTRASLAFYTKEKVHEKGCLLGEDFIYAHPDGRLRMQYRLSWFHTDSYNSRIYAFENNVLYAYSFPSFMEKGWRTYLNMSWKPYKGLTAYLKTGLTVYPGREDLGSGVSRIEGNKRYDLSLQVRWVF